MNTIRVNKGIFNTAKTNLSETAKRLGLDEKILCKIRNPKEQIDLRFHPIFPDGRVVEGIKARGFLP